MFTLEEVNDQRKVYPTQASTKSTWIFLTLTSEPISPLRNFPNCLKVFEEGLSNALSVNSKGIFVSKNPLIVSKWWSCEEIVLAGTEEYQPEMEYADLGLEGCNESV